MDTPPKKIITLDGTSSDNGPKKYIRTFEGDMEMLKKGGTPDLQPLLPKADVPNQVPRPVPAPLPITPPPPPVPPLPSPKATEGTAPQITEPRPSPIQTYSSDFSERLRQTQASTATVLAAEQDAKGVTVTEEKQSRRGVVFVVIGIVLLILGGVGAYVGYTRYLAQIQLVALPPPISAAISVDEREEITAGPPSEIVLALTQSLARPLASNAVRLIYSALSTTTDNSIFAALQPPAPNILLRNIYAPGSMAGVVNAGGVQTPFFILSVASYSDTFAGMLSWEPRMPGDLAALFPSFAEGFGGQAPSSTSTAAVVATSTPVFSVFFHDEVVDNHDVRIYRDARGQSVVLYGYWDQHTLIIARDPAAFTELLSRLATTRR